MHTPDSNDPIDPLDPVELRPVNPYSPPEANLAGEDVIVGAFGVLGQIMLALGKILAVLASAFIAFFATCVATLSVSDQVPLYFISPVVGLAVLIGMSYYLFSGRTRSRGKK